MDFINRKFLCMNTQVKDQFTENGTNGVLILIPKIYTTHEILSWHLTELLKFTFINITCNSYCWSTDGTTYNYSGVNNWWTYAIFELPEFPDKYSIYVSNKMYKMFFQNTNPEVIPQKVYNKIFIDRGLPVPHTKALCYEKIVNAGRENLLQYNNFKLPDLIEIPAVYKELYTESLTFPITDSYVYELISPNIKEKKFKSILEKEIKCEDTRLKPFLAKLSIKSQNIYVPGNKSRFEFYFNFTLPTDIPNYLHQCLECGKYRWLGSYMCLEHINLAVEDYKEKIQKKLNEDIKLLCKNLEEYRKIKVPANLFLKFARKNKTYDIPLELVH